MWKGESEGATSEVLVFWDNRVLKLVGMEVQEFSISCFKNCEMGLSRFSRGCMVPFVGVIERAFGWSWGPLRACGVTCCALEMVLTLLDFQGSVLVLLGYLWL